MDMAELLRIDSLQAGYGEAVVLQDISLSLEEGHTLALLGRNGTGKTTLMDSIVGVTTRHGGRISLAMAARMASCAAALDWILSCASTGCSDSNREQRAGKAMRAADFMRMYVLLIMKAARKPGARHCVATLQDRHF